MIDKLIEQQETIKGMQENEESAIKIMKMYEDYKLRIDKAIKYINNRGVKRIYNGKNYIGLDGLNTQILLDILKGDDKE